MIRLRQDGFAGQAPTPSPPEGVLAVARALAILHARRDHIAELAKQTAAKDSDHG